MVDHSCGNYCQVKSGLHVNKMRKGFDGNQPHIHYTMIFCERGFLGMHNPRLNVGQEQQMMYKYDDYGPFYLDAMEQE